MIIYCQVFLRNPIKIVVSVKTLPELSLVRICDHCEYFGREIFLKGMLTTVRGVTWNVSLAVYHYHIVYIIHDQFM